MTTVLYLIPLWLVLSLPVGMLIGQMIAVSQGYGDDRPPRRAGGVPAARAAARWRL